MGRARKRQLGNAGDKIEKSALPLDQQIHDSHIVKKKKVDVPNNDHDDDNEIKQIAPKQLSKVLRSAQQQAAGDSDEEVDTTEKKPTKSLKTINDGDFDEEDDTSEIDYDPSEIKVDERDARDLERFLQPNEGGNTIYDLIRQKLDEKNNANLVPLGTGEPSIPREAVQLYNELGVIMSRYRTGKVPVAFKNLATLPNWEEIIEHAHPETWSSAAMMQATKLFMSSQKSIRAQRFLNMIVLPRIRDEIASHRSLNPYLYQTLFKACFKPAAFYKGIVLPLAESGSCTLIESVIVGSVILKCRVPPMHSCAAIFRLASLRGSNFASGLYFMQILLRKKYALPYQVVDKLVEFFAETGASNEELPLLWHRALLLFVESYANDLSGPQVTLLQLISKEKQNHYGITPQIMSRLREAEAKIEQEGDSRMEVEA
uniref:Bystin n=1 Tax=Panagrellus redivivus TaxID=6233 RepID=A0A7E4ZU67_PANRE